MSSPSLRAICLELLTGSAERFLDLQWSDGRFAGEPEQETEEWNFFDQQYVLPAAVLYVTEHPDNPWRGDPRLWEAILRHGRHIDSRIAPDGTMRWRLRGVVLTSPFVCQRLTCAFLMAYQLLSRRLPEEEGARWRAAILRACGWLAEHQVIPYRGVPRFISHHIRTSTNHFSLYLSLLWLAGREFARQDWVELSADLMRRLIADQRPAGYWEEHHGPTLGYDYLTYHGVDQYTEWSGDQAGLTALRAGLELHRHWTYPDGIAVECVDGRMRHLSGPMLWGLAGFSRWSEGRGYARLLLEAAAKQRDQLSGETLARVAEAYLRAREGEETPPPQAIPRYRATLEEVSVVGKEGPWTFALSGQCSPPWPESPFNLDRQARLSLWREGTGLVLDGSNSKFQPELATFCRRVGGAADHIPLKARVLESGEDDAVESEYAGFTGTVRARTLDSEAVDLRFEAAERAGGQITVAVVPHVSRGESFAIEGRGEVTLGDDAFTVEPSEHAGAIVFRGVKLRLPEGARIEYPVSPFNSYSADHSSGPSANRMVARCPIGERGLTFRAEASG